jgi:hypothetical protein
MTINVTIIDFPKELSKSNMGFNPLLLPRAFTFKEKDFQIAGTLHYLDDLEVVRDDVVEDEMALSKEITAFISMSTVTAIASPRQA